MLNAQFVERAGVLLEVLGMPRMVGRVLGALLQAPPTGFTPANLAESLQVSRAAISSALQQLLLAQSTPSTGITKKLKPVNTSVQIEDMGNSQDFVSGWQQLAKDTITCIEQP